MEVAINPKDVWQQSYRFNKEVKPGELEKFLHCPVFRQEQAEFDNQRQTLSVCCPLVQRH